MKAARRSWWLGIAAIVAIGGFGLCDVRGQEAVYDVDQVKAAFLYHFGTYVMWPDPPAAAPLTIAVLNDERVAEQLAQFLPGRRIENRPVEARHITRIEELADDDIVFIGSSNNLRLSQLIAAIGQRPMLVVTDAPEGLERGATINFQQVDSRLRFEISVPNAEAAGLTLSSRLLSAALRVETARCCSATSEAQARINY
jgi:hypothetical protein